MFASRYIDSCINLETHVAPYITIFHVPGRLTLVHKDCRKREQHTHRAVKPTPSQNAAVAGFSIHRQRKPLTLLHSLPQSAKAR